jgi:hypothetical protein
MEFDKEYNEIIKLTYELNQIDIQHRHLNSVYEESKRNLEECKNKQKK